MTTIVIDLKEMEVFADTQTTISTRRQCGGLLDMLSGVRDEGEDVVSTEKNVKVKKLKDNVIFTAAGDRCLIDLCFEYLKEGRGLPPVKWKGYGETTIITIENKGGCSSVQLYSVDEESNRPKWSSEVVTRDTGFITLGSGSKYAYGALMAGINPSEAITAASKSDPYTNNHVSKGYFDENGCVIIENEIYEV